MVKAAKHIGRGNQNERVLLASSDFESSLAKTPISGSYLSQVITSYLNLISVFSFSLLLYWFYLLKGKPFFRKTVRFSISVSVNLSSCLWLPIYEVLETYLQASVLKKLATFLFVGSPNPNSGCLFDKEKGFNMGKFWVLSLVCSVGFVC